jgi:hypothetical protein
MKQTHTSIGSVVAVPVGTVLFAQFGQPEHDDNVSSTPRTYDVANDWCKLSNFRCWRQSDRAQSNGKKQQHVCRSNRNQIILLTKIFDVERSSIFLFWLGCGFSEYVQLLILTDRKP